MNDVVVSKKLMNFCLMHIVESMAYSQRLGVDSEVLGYHIPNESYPKVRKMIDNEEFPAGYYKICDILGEEY